jgi:hypothetical protein
MRSRGSIRFRAQAPLFRRRHQKSFQLIMSSVLVQRPMLSPVTPPADLRIRESYERGLNRGGFLLTLGDS